MESKDLLRPDSDENQNLEVNSGSSNEDQSVVESNESTSIENESENISDLNHEVQIFPIEESTDESTLVEQTSEINQPIEKEDKTQTADISETHKVKPIPASKELDSVNGMMSDIESTQKESEIEDENEEGDTDTSVESVEDIENEYKNLSPEASVEELEKIAAEPDYNKTKKRVGILKANILSQLKIFYKEQLDTHIQGGGTKEDFEQSAPEWEGKFYQALSVFKNNKTLFIEELEKEKERNLQAKLEILEGLKALIDTDTSLKEKNDKFKEYQDKWKAIGPVPQNESNNLWQNFHFYVEKFFDLLRINKEFRSLDLKKNLEQKIELCERAETLLLENSINKSFKMLQQLHDEWKELGPVPEDKKEEIWERFKNASDQINQRRREYYDKLYSTQQNNYNAKVVLCEQVEELIAKDPQSIKEHNEISDRLTDFMKVWKTLGPAPSKLNDEIWTRFKKSIDTYFNKKKEYFRQLKEEQMQNYNLKLNLAIRAEGISERTDWRQATEEILQLQKEWKNIGVVPRKQKEIIWKRFRAACDQFFAAKSHYFENIQDIEAENLKKKEELIQQILTHEFTADKEENMQAMQNYQRQWTEIGHVPKKEIDRLYNDYREALNKRFGDLKMSMEDVRRDRFKNKIDNILNDPNANRLLDKEKRTLINKMTQLKDEINLLENNLGFFAHSKNADLLKEEFTKKIENAKKEVKDLEYKIRMMEKSKK